MKDELRHLCKIRIFFWVCARRTVEEGFYFCSLMLDYFNLFLCISFPCNSGNSKMSKVICPVTPAEITRNLISLCFRWQCWAVVACANTDKQVHPIKIKSQRCLVSFCSCWLLTLWHVLGVQERCEQPFVQNPFFCMDSWNGSGGWGKSSSPWVVFYKK